MNKTTLITLLCLCLWAIRCKEAPEAKTESLTDKVNLFIGTGGKGKTYPGATVPYGMVQLSPDNGRNGWDWISGYFYPDSVIAGFSHLHLTGTGAGDLYDISFFPTSGPLKQARLDEINRAETVYSLFSHNKEEAEPGYYWVYLEDYGIDVELTATERTGLQRYHFEQTDAQIRLNLGYTRNWDAVTDSYIHILNDSTIRGYRKSSGWASDQRVFFVSVFSRPISGAKLFQDNKWIPGDSIKGLNVLAVFDFSGQNEVMVKTGISAVSIENARLNLEAEQQGFDFEGVKQAASERWEEQLAKVEIKASPDNEVQFYTAMYHSMLAPVLFSDVNGQYRGPDGNLYHMASGNRYTLFSLWDTYRALHPWMTIIHSERVPDLIHSMLGFYGEYGKLPVWNMHGNETHMMMGYHAVPVIADAYLKGIGDFDPELAYEAMKTSAMQDEFGLKAYRELGYVPHETISWNVSRTLEYAFDDWCIAQVAKELGKEEDYVYFAKRAGNFHNHFDAETGFFRAKNKEGAFKTPFDPLSYTSEDYCEANAWQYYAYVPHNVPGLIALAGGEKAFREKLDEMFEMEQEPGELPDWISGYIGQYVHGNEPGHHVPYLYQYAGQPEKTQRYAREIMNTLYTTQPDGLCGNEDCGQMSAWYMFSALGFYPVNPADGRYILGSPEVEEAVLRLPGEKTLRIIAQNQSEKNIHVKSIKLNGQDLERYYIEHEEIMKGGMLEFVMTDQQPW